MNWYDADWLDIAERLSRLGDPPSTTTATAQTPDTTSWAYWSNGRATKASGPPQGHMRIGCAVPGEVPFIKRIRVRYFYTSGYSKGYPYQLVCVTCRFQAQLPKRFMPV